MPKMVAMGGKKDSFPKLFRRQLCSARMTACRMEGAVATSSSRSRGAEGPSLLYVFIHTGASPRRTGFPSLSLRRKT